MQSPPDTAPVSGPEVMGQLLLSVAGLPREPSTDILLTQAFLQAEAQALQSAAYRAGLVACLARLRYPGDEHARGQDEAQWGMLLSEPLGQQLLFGPKLTPEQRLAHLSFLLLRPELPLGLLEPTQGHLPLMAAHEAQLALQAFPAEQVAPVARFPEALVPRLSELAALPLPVDAQALAGLVPEGLPPERAAQFLLALADEAFAVTLEDSGVQAQRQAFALLSAEGLRALAERMKTETEPQPVAQLLVLGGLQHQAFFQNLPLLTRAALAGLGHSLESPGTDSSLVRELSSTSVSLLGMALGGPVGVATARVVLGKVFHTVDALCEGGRLPLGALAGEVLGLPGLGPTPQAMGEVAAALTQLYAAQLTELGEEAAGLLEPLLPLLFRGEVEGLGEAWASQLGNPEWVALFQEADAEARSQVLRVLLVGGAVGAFSWDSVAPALQAQAEALWGLASPGGTPAPSAAWAVAVLANDELFQAVLEGALSREEALAEARQLGARLFVGGTEPGDEVLAAAMVGALATSP